MHEGAWSARLGIPGRPAEAESSIVARDLALAAAHRRPLPRAAPVERGSRSSSCAPRRPTACASPPSARRSTSCSPTSACAGFDPVFKMNPPLREQRRRRRAPRRRSPTAPSTRSPPTTRRTRPRRRTCRSRRRRPGCSASRPRSRSCITTLVEPGVLTLAAGARRAVVAAGARSPASTPTATAVRSRPGRPRTSACSTRPTRGWSTRTRLASRSRELALGRLEAHRQGPPHDPRAATRPCATASPTR